MRRLFALVCCLALLAINFLAAPGVFANTTDSTTYGSGNYSNCDYGSCTITLASSGAVSLNVTPSPSTACTVQYDPVTVTTDSTTGYTLNVTTSTTATAMTSGANSIASSTASQASPAVLTADRWGYRADGVGGFGAGPTSAQSNGSVPSATFAGVPASNATAAQIASTSSPSSSGTTTKVWYGLCADSAAPSGNYSITVTYTAVTN